MQTVISVRLDGEQKSIKTNFPQVYISAMSGGDVITLGTYHYKLIRKVFNFNTDQIILMVVQL